MPRHYCCYCCCCCCLVVIAETDHMYEKFLLKLLLQRSAGSMASQRSDPVECVHCFAISSDIASIKFMHCKACTQIVCEVCMRNHNDCTPWYKTSTADTNTQGLAPVSKLGPACASTRVLARVDGHHAAGAFTYTTVALMPQSTHYPKPPPPELLDYNYQNCI